MAGLGWSHFAEAAPDDILLFVLRHLEGASVLPLLTSAASVSVRLAGGEADMLHGTGDLAVEHVAVQAVAGTPLAEGPPSVVQRLATDALGHAAASAAFAAAARADAVKAAGRDPAPRVHFCNGPVLAALRAPAGPSPTAGAVRLALDLAGVSFLTSAVVQQPWPGSERRAPAEIAADFLDALFRREVRRAGILAPEQHGDEAYACLTLGAQRGDPLPATSTASESAADAVLDTVLASDEGGQAIAQAAAEAVSALERELDRLVDSGDGIRPGAYEALAKQRSAAEFLRERFSACMPMSKPCAAARQRLDDAAAMLDETIRGYVQEGFSLTCPRLGRVVRSSCFAPATQNRWQVPYSHWWVFLGGACGEYGVCA